MRARTVTLSLSAIAVIGLVVSMVLYLSGRSLVAKRGELRSVAERTWLLENRIRSLEFYLSSAESSRERALQRIEALRRRAHQLERRPLARLFNEAGGCLVDVGIAFGSTADASKLVRAIARVLRTEHCSDHIPGAWNLLPRNLPAADS